MRAPTPVVRKLLALVSFVSFVSLDPLVRARADEVHFSDGGMQADCQVLEESVEHVVYRLDGAGNIRQSRPARDVARVVRSNVPERLAQGLALLDARRLRDALAPLEAASNAGPAWARERAALSLATAHLGLDDGPSALRALDALLAASPKTRLLADALIARAQALLLGRDADAVRAALIRAREAIAKHDLGGRAGLRVDLEEARLAVVLDDDRGALERFTRLVSAAAREPDVLAAARIGRARALVDTGDAERAVIELRALLAREDALPPTIAARALVLLGDAELVRARPPTTSPSATPPARPAAALPPPRSAFLAYLRAALVHGDDAGPDAARALREAARLARAHPSLGGEARARELEAEERQLVRR